MKSMILRTPGLEAVPDVDEGDAGDQRAGLTAGSR
jgi:hypothetical protein